jgi:hypothetical protein
MITTVAEVGSTMWWAGLIVAGAAALMPSLAWLIGLALALRKSAPAERADILRAYAAFRLPLARVGPEKDRDNCAADAGQIADK